MPDEHPYFSDAAFRQNFANRIEEWADAARTRKDADLLQVLLILHAALVSNRVDALARFMGERIEEELAVIQKMTSASTN